MISSMTGFGRSEWADDTIKLTVEMKSVNSKYLDLNLKMPRKFNIFEGNIRTLLKSFASRGKIDLYRITRERINGAAYDIVPVLEGGRTTGIGTEKNEKLSGLTGGALPRVLQGRSALGLYEALNAGVEEMMPLNPFAPLDQAVFALKWIAGRMPWAGRRSPQPPKEIVELGNAIFGSLFGKKLINYYFET